MTTTIPRASAILRAARTLAAKLLLAVPIDRAALSEAMTESAGGNDAAGAWQQRDSFEALEVALSLAIPELVGRMETGAAISTLEPGAFRSHPKACPIGRCRAPRTPFVSST